VSRSGSPSGSESFASTATVTGAPATARAASSRATGAPFAASTATLTVAAETPPRPSLTA
jgi:hypothetical protein